MKRRHLNHQVFRLHRHGCLLCGDLYPYPERIFDGHLVVAACFKCMAIHRGRLVQVLEAKVREYFASERAFWHPGEPIGPQPPPEKETAADGQDDTVKKT